MQQTREETLKDLYNLILNPSTREWERSRLVEVKDQLEKGQDVNAQLAKLEAELRPLATRNNLTPDVADFYLRMTGDPVGEMSYDLSKHYQKDAPYVERAIFAGGCFWCMVEPFETRPGILSIVSGYTGGETENPSYEQVSGGYTGHVEAVEIIFDTRLITYKELVTVFWQLIDPTDEYGQFQDRGVQYQTVIFVKNPQQRKIAEESKKALNDSGKYKLPVVTKIQSAETFWPAENYHQEFYKKQPKRYKRIKHARQELLFYQQLKSKIRLLLRRNKELKK